MFPLRDSARSRGTPVVNYLIILANLLVFAYEALLSPRAQEAFIFSYGFIPREFFSDPFSPQALSIFTSMFVHGGWFHVISNMWALYIFGDNIEGRLGHSRYLFFYLVSGAAAALTHGALSPGSDIPTVGASGAVAGVMGAYILAFPHSRIITLVPIFFIPWFIEVPALLFIGVWVFSQLFSGVLSLAAGVDAFAPVAWWAHVGGFAAGLGLVLLLTGGQPRPRRA
ncbi:MAG: rhomboid family intramembrane serine protease [Anaerolineae bacterium]|nr:rhomboid family intramembrane serine protease [Anaerolineae bacterium]